MTKILLVEDDDTITFGIRAALAKRGYEVTGCISLAEAKQVFSKVFALVLLDLNLPDGSGYEFCRWLKEQYNTPIIFLTVRDAVGDITKGLDMGADDYLTKPIGTSELLARIRTALRHSNRLNTGSLLYKRPFCSRDLIIDFEKHKVTLAGKEIHFTQIEFKIIALLAQNSGRVMTYDTIISNIWGPYADDDNSILRVNMAHIRRKLEQNPAEPKYVFTEIGIGYRMVEDEMH